MKGSLTSIWFYAGTALLLEAAGPSSGIAPSGSAVVVASSGRAHASLLVAGGPVSADIVTRVTPVASGVATACTLSRTPCSLVSSLTLRVGADAIPVPSSLIVRLADVNRMELHPLTAKAFELRLSCGDASEAYQARIRFNTRRVTQLDIVNGEAGMLSERTIYSDLSHAFDD